MPFQERKNVILWKVHFTSPITTVYRYLTTDSGRCQFWAEKTVEENGYIEFTILNYPKYKAKIIEQRPNDFFRLNYFGTDTRFELVMTKDGGTDFTLIVRTPSEEVKQEMTAGWVSVLMAMKAAVDFGVDLRNHHPHRVWDNGYLNN